jgi:hypothetical protein
MRQKSFSNQTCTVFRLIKLLTGLLAAVMVFSCSDMIAEQGKKSSLVTFAAAVTSPDNTIVVTLMNGTTVVTDATVTAQVNGAEPVAVPFVVTQYLLIGVPLKMNDTVVIHAVRDGVDATGTVIIPAQPAITAPTQAGGPYNVPNPLDVTWTIQADPRSYNISIAGEYTESGLPYSADVTNVLAHRIPGSMLKKNKAGVGVHRVILNCDTRIRQILEPTFWVKVPGEIIYYPLELGKTLDTNSDGTTLGNMITVIETPALSGNDQIRVDKESIR